MTMFVQTMVLYPDVQRRAQEEIDRVIGRDRLPEMADKDSLPYVNAIIKELLRYTLSLLSPDNVLTCLLGKVASSDAYGYV